MLQGRGDAGAVSSKRCSNRVAIFGTTITALGARQQGCGTPATGVAPAGELWPAA
jgi:hypothetical protein